MAKIAILIPVAKFEPVYLVKYSLESINKLRSNGNELRAIYIVDSDNPKSQQICELVINSGFECVIRDPRGRKAGAINDGLKLLERDCPDYIAILDADSRPDPDFILRCLEGFKWRDVAMVVGLRYALNSEMNFLTRILAAEYTLINLTGILTQLLDGFKCVGGILGLIRSSELIPEGLDESSLTEDLDFISKLYLKGKRVWIEMRAKMGEQAPIGYSELIAQRSRWAYGAFQSFAKYGSRMMVANIPLHRKLSYFLTMIIPWMLWFGPFLEFVFIPLIWMRSKGMGDFMLRYYGLKLHAILYQFCAARTWLKWMLGRSQPWGIHSRIPA